MIHLSYCFDVCSRNKVIFFVPQCLAFSPLRSSWTLDGDRDPWSWNNELFWNHGGENMTPMFFHKPPFLGGYNKIHCFYLVAGGVWQNPQGLCSCFGRSIWLMHPNRYSARQNLWEMLGRITGSQHLSPITTMDLKNMTCMSILHRVTHIGKHICICT